VQQSSDATLRLFDWNRAGPEGKPRPLHVREALEAISWDAGPVAPAEGTPLPGLPEGVRGEALVRCPYFSLDRFTAAAPFAFPAAGRLSIWMMADGAAELAGPEGGYRRRFRRGETVLVPASAGPLSWQPAGEGPATLLAASLP
jgi:mannose-6-phosphate isomerase